MARQMLLIIWCIMSKAIGPKEFEAIKKSADEAFIRYVLEANWFEEFSDDDHLLHDLALQPLKERNLSEGKWPEAIAQAVTRNDQKFFRKLGRILAEGPLPEQRRWKSRGKVAEFILLHWAVEFAGVPPLYTLTPEDAADVCSREHNNTAVSADMVVKLRQRMKLKPWRGRKVPLKRVNGHVVYKREEATR